ncbi:ABC transporter substrate-binding protein [Alicycliphilus denitrificans]|uniref:ABC transporter substrate-binding protein n=1 Tax=Alicycliphilus denitrificans TaxID=179636 RepID=UPI00384AC008
MSKRTPLSIRWRRLLRFAVALAALPAGLAIPGAPAQAGEVQDRVQASGAVRVCIWPQYQGITWRDPRTGQLQGLDIDMARALAGELHMTLQFIDSSFPDLVPDLLHGRCDVAMFGVAMLPQRMEKLAFTAPYLQGDIHAITTRTSRLVRQWSDIDQSGVVVGVQAGTFMESAMRERLRQATLAVVAPPHTRERELLAGRIDVFMTDYPYGQHLLASADWATLLAPPQSFFPLPYAYAVRPGDAQWMATLDAFVTRIRQDGRLRAAARRHGLEGMLAR